MKLHIRTFGCQMNVHDSDRMADLLGIHGFYPIEQPEEADVIIVNTCSVREKAAHKAISETGRMCTYKKINPKLVVILAGCVAEQEKEKLLKALPALDMVVGPDHYKELPKLIDDRMRQRNRFAVTGFDEGAPEDFLAIEGPSPSSGPIRYLTIMKGCSRHCAYCIVPTVRGKERFRDVDGILKEAEQLVANGARELVLLGQTVNGYRQGDVTFARLLSMLDEISALRRLRFTSPHPRHMTDELIESYGRLRTLCESIHLPVQAGSDSVLRAMRRGYTADYVREVGRKLKATHPDFQISSDLIVGFPGETEADFMETIRLYEDVRFFGAFSFKYSPRPGTPAAETMVDDVSSEEKSRRLDALHQVIDRIDLETKESLIGRTLEILIEGGAKLKGQITGRARNNQIVNVKLPNDGILEAWIGRTVNVEIVRALPHCLEGKWMEEEP
jgi:tRNA-2-methylthio-N6-dimethylallyladenosine synthase